MFIHKDMGARANADVQHHQDSGTLICTSHNGCQIFWSCTGLTTDVFLNNVVSPNSVFFMRPVQVLFALLRDTW